MGIRVKYIRCWERHGVSNLEGLAQFSSCPFPLLCFKCSSVHRERGGGEEVEVEEGTKWGRRRCVICLSWEWVCSVLELCRRSKETGCYTQQVLVSRITAPVGMYTNFIIPFVHEWKVLPNSLLVQFHCFVCRRNRSLKSLFLTLPHQLACTLTLSYPLYTNVCMHSVHAAPCWETRK